MTGPGASRGSRIAFDLGGTFTDVISLTDGGELVPAKVLSLADRVGEDVRRSLPESAGERSGTLRHASTVASNAVIEGRLAAVGLITTAGFRDVLEMRDQRRPPLIDADWMRPEPLVPRHLRQEVRERVLADGSVDQALDPDEARAAVATLERAGVEAIAVCLINSYLNPVHEQLIAAVAQDVAAELPVCISSDGFAAIREYERTSTTALNAALLPGIRAYLDRLEEQLRVPPGSLLIMKSDAGMMSSMAARRAPVRMVESGPAAGVLAAAAYAQRTALPYAIAFDMGGTTAKASPIEHGVPERRARAEVGAEGTFASRLFGGAGHVVAAPTLDIVEVGAGGGSIAAVGSDGALHVGPQGAGADPGPACYGRGGTLPTVTDANVVLGYMNPVAIAGGAVSIDRDAAARAIEEQIARPLGLGLHEAALGIVRVADATMLRAIRAVSIERGRDARDGTLIAYGGSGPVHAARLAESLDMRAVHVPELCGLFSAVGLLLADRRTEAALSLFRPLVDIEAAWAEDALASLSDSATAEMEAEGIAIGRFTLSREADLQYRHEQATLTVTWPTRSSDASLRASLAENFIDEHRRRFGFEAEEAIFLTALRVRATSEPADPDDVPHPRAAVARGPEHRSRPAYFGASTRGMVQTPVADRRDLGHDWTEGPLLVEEPESVTVVPPGWRVRREDSGAIALTPEHIAPGGPRR